MTDRPVRGAPVSPRAAVVEQLRARTRGPLASRRRRSVLAWAYLGAVAVAAAAPLVLAERPAAAVGLASFVAMAALWYVLRRMTGLVADAPSDGLDDLMVRLRDRCYVVAYQAMGGAVALGCLVLWIGGSDGLSASAAVALGWAEFGLVLGLPVVVTAVSLPDVDPEG